MHSDKRKNWCQSCYFWRSILSRGSRQFLRWQRVWLNVDADFLVSRFSLVKARRWWKARVGLWCPILAGPVSDASVSGVLKFLLLTEHHLQVSFLQELTSSTTKCKFVDLFGWSSSVNYSHWPYSHAFLVLAGLNAGQQDKSIVPYQVNSNWKYYNFSVLRIKKERV